MQLPPLGLYIHLPWCERKCPYCDFNSHEVAAIPESQYIDCLLADLEADRALARDRPVRSIFIGGGTPSLFSAAGIARVLKGVAAIIELDADAEITLEANPGSAEACKFRGFREAGVNRLSLGIQSFDDARLTALGRIHNSDQAHAAIEHARSAGFDNFNIDLMHGLPGQDAAGACEDLAQALGHEPPHLSWYQLTIEQNTVFYKRPPLLPVEDELADIQAEGEQLLAAGGYQQYEVSAYSQPERQCRHNLNYWHFGDYLAMGAGAHGKITAADGSITRYAKTRLPQDYMKAAPGSCTASSTPLAAEDIAGEFMLNALRLNAGFTPQDFTHMTGLPLASVQATLQSLIERELLQQDEGGIRTTVLGRRFLDSVVLEFF